tara:strand:+ start:2199 stop:2624 length:426 start_codon:yes stop_codon:yes gene_type:complete
MLGNKLEDKIKVWKDLRNRLEDHPRPFDMLVQFTNKLHVSSKKVNAFDPDSKIEPWHLIEKNEFTEYEIAQLIAYTLQLTDRFCDSNIEIHISKDTKKDNLVYLVYLDKGIILGYYNEAITVDELPKHIVSQKIYRLPPLH